VESSQITERGRGGGVRWVPEHRWMEVLALRRDGEHLGSSRSIITIYGHMCYN